MSWGVLGRVGLRRLVQAVPIILGVSFIVFGILNLLPGGTARAILGENTQVTPALLHAENVKLGLNHPFFYRYFLWLWHALHLNFGRSLTTSQSVASIIGSRVPVSLELGVLAFIEALVFAVPVAMLAAWRPKGFIDRLNLIVSMIGYACPAFVIALLLILIFSVHLHLLPSIGFHPLSAGPWQNLRTLILPSVSIAFGIFCGYTRLLRADIVDQMNQADYVVAVRAKGVDRWQTLFHHALRNSLYGLITIVALNVGVLAGGAVLVETIFDLPGMGQELLTAINTQDVPTVQAVVTLIACMVIVANLIADVLYAVLDPRIRYGTAGS